MKQHTNWDSVFNPVRISDWSIQSLSLGISHISVPICTQYPNHVPATVDDKVHGCKSIREAVACQAQLLFEGLVKSNKSVTG